MSLLIGVLSTGVGVVSSEVDNVGVETTDGSGPISTDEETGGLSGCIPACTPTVALVATLAATTGCTTFGDCKAVVTNETIGVLGGAASPLARSTLVA